MSTYSDVLSQAQNLTLEEQEQLLEVLSVLVRDRVTTQTQGKRSEIDAALMEMAQDPEYQSQVLQMEAEFRRQRTVEILEKIAANNVCNNINDPVEWQRELRQDRSLPGRDE
jgi:transcriptional regulator of met regulon